MSKLAEILRRNMLLKISAVVCAIVLWVFVQSSTNPLRDKTFYNVEVIPLNEATLASNRLIILGDWKQRLKDFRVDIRVPRDELDKVKKEDIVATIDLNKITSKGEYDIPIGVTGPTRVTEITPSMDSIHLEVDDLITREVPVQARFEGVIPEGYWRSEPQISPSNVTISGAKTDVERIQQALCTISQESLTRGLNDSMLVTLKDQEGKTLENLNLTDELPSVIVKMDVFPKKTVALDVESAVVGRERVADNYEVKNVTVTPKGLEIAAPAHILSTIDKLQMQTLNVQNKNETVVETVQIILPDEVVVVNGGAREAEVVVEIGPKQATKEFDPLSISVKGLGAGLKSTILETAAATVVGDITEINALKQSAIAPYVSVSGLKAGEYTLEVKSSIIGGSLDVRFNPSMVRVILQ